MTRWPLAAVVALASITTALGFASSARATPDPSVQLPAPDPSVQPPAPGPSVQPPAPGPSVQPPAPGPSSQSPPDQAFQPPTLTDGPSAFAGGVRCRSDPSAAIAAGGVWDGGGRCYVVREGLTISSPVVVENATFVDPQSERPRGESVHPIVRIKDTSDVTLSSLVLVGADTTGAFHAPMVGAAGIDLLGSNAVTITNVSTVDTFGDGMTLGFQPRHAPNSDLTVDGLTISNAGREGVTLAYVQHARMDGVTILGPAGDAWDFESDLPGVGSGDVVVTNSASDHGVRILEWLSGPITFDSAQISGDVSVIGEAAQSGQSVSFQGGTILQKNDFHGTPPAGIWIDGPGRLQFTDVTIGRLPALRPPTGPAWLAVEGAHLTFDGGSRLPPFGTNDATSTVVFTG